MTQDILFGSGIRTLGTATTDLGLYGGQGDTVVAIREALTEPRDEAEQTPNPHSLSAIHSLSSAPEPITTPADSASEGVAQATPLGSNASIALQAVDVAPAIGAAPGITAFHFAPGAVSFETQFDLSGRMEVLPSTYEDTTASSLDIAAHDAVDLAAPGAGTLAAPAADAATPLLDTIGHTVDAGLGSVSNLADFATDGLVATLSAVGDTLEGLAGSDPASGVATLVSLISVTDMFDLHPVDAALPETASDPGLGVLDTLVTDESPIAVLLGGAHDGDHGLGLDHADLDHSLGL